MKPIYWDKACNYLKSKDEILKVLINKYDSEFLIKSADPFHTMLRAIVGQQVSVKSADAVWNRIMSNFITNHPDQIYKASDEILKTLGLSRQKISYFKNIALYFIETDIKLLENLKQEELLNELIKIKGVGTWTAQMFAMFYLNLPNILPLGDIALIKAIENNYNNSSKMSLSEITDLSAIWNPYKTVATWYLWRSLDPYKINY